MTCEIESDDAFMQELLANVDAVPWSAARAYYNRDGDCIEVLLSNESYRAERLDALVTVYMGRETGQLAGALIKGIRRFIHEVLQHCPGFKIEIVDRKIRVESLFIAGLWARRDAPDGTVVQTYRTLKEVSERANLEVELEPA